MEETLPESVAVDPKVLDRFFEWGIKSCGAKKYAVFFWGHSSGPSGLFSDNAPSYFLSRTLGLATLGRVLERVKKDYLTDGRSIDIIVFKDCFQSILETAFELGRTEKRPERTHYIIATQGLVPVAKRSATGPVPIEVWPYKDLVSYLKPGASPEDVARQVVARLRQFYKDPQHRGDHEEVPWALLDVTKVDQLRHPLTSLSRELAKALRSSDKCDLALGALRSAFRGRHAGSDGQPVYDGDPMVVDLSSLCHKLKWLEVRELTAAAESLESGMKDLVVSPHPKSKFCGVGIYYYPPLPKDREGSAIGGVFNATYERLRLSELTGWDQVALQATPSMIVQEGPDH
jgi:hypothetical protein